MDSQLIVISLLVLIFLQTSWQTYALLKKRQQNSGQSIYIDSSVLMDGRIISIAKTGFFPGTLVIPRSVIGEMQFLADNGDTEKRERARRGLDTAKELQSLEMVNVEILQDGSRAEEGVDDRLLSLAKKYGGAVCTIDFNLNKVAQVEGVPVLNINELARELRMSYLPGDSMRLELTSRGSDSHQAVGHLADGTMVVVERAVGLVGTNVDIEVVRSIQTAAGRMMFAKLKSPKKKTLITSPKVQRKKNGGQRPLDRSRAVRQIRSHGQEDKLIELVDRQARN